MRTFVVWLQINQRTFVQYSLIAFLVVISVEASVLSLPRCQAVELAGSSDARAAVLRKLARGAADSPIVHWYRGELRDAGRWTPIERVEQAASADERLDEYETKRAAIDDISLDHVRLAKWCEKQGLIAQANVHWMYVLRGDPNHPAALIALDLAWHDGLLMTRQERNRYRERQRLAIENRRAWRHRAAKLQQRLNNDAQRDEARQELMAIDDPAAVPALLATLTELPPAEGEDLSVWTTMVVAMGRFNVPAALEFLAEVAVNAEDRSLRYAALKQLREKDWAEVVPVLIGGMQTPIEASLNMQQVDSGVVNTYRYTQQRPGGGQYERRQTDYRQTPAAKYTTAPIYETRKVRDAYTQPGSTYTFWCPKINQYMTVDRPGKEVPAQYGRFYVDQVYGENPYFTAAQQQTVAQSRAAGGRIAIQVAQTNRVIAQQNRRIAGVLTEITGQTLQAFPESWWNWWGDYLDRNPGVATQGVRQQLNAALLNQSHRGLARGTRVWTIRGRRPIETILPGDLVLSQNPRTGELAYKAVFAVNAIQRRDVQLASTSDGKLYCTPGHVLWRAGAGWQRLSSIASGDRLHALNSAPSIVEKTDAYAIDVYDLIVDEFHNCFVGEEGVLVHDATPIAPIDMALPGIERGSPAGVFAMSTN